MKQYEIERVRTKTHKGWEFSGLTESPYVKGKGPLTAQFHYVVVENGRKIEDHRLVMPSMVAFTKEELLDGSLPRIHLDENASSLVKNALKQFERAALFAAAAQASNDDIHEEPQRQMAASMPSSRSMSMGG